MMPPLLRLCVSPTQVLEEARCSTMGVFAPIVGMVGTMQAAEALKVLCGLGAPLTGRLLLIDALRAEFNEMRLQRDPACPVCGHLPKG